MACIPAWRSYPYRTRDSQVEILSFTVRDSLSVPTPVPPVLGILGKNVLYVYILLGAEAAFQGPPQK